MSATRTATRPRIFELLEQARPFAERHLYAGLRCELAAAPEDLPLDDMFDAQGEWRDLVAPEAATLIRSLDTEDPASAKLFDAAHQMHDAGFLLGIAIGKMLRT